jgi:hypothetical protein
MKAMHDKPQGDLVQPISTCYAKLWSASEVTPDVFEFLNEHANAPIKDRAEVVLVDQVQRSLKNVAAIASEEYFKQCPDLSSDHEVKLDIVYGEFRSSQNAGRPIEHDTFFDRFPEMRVELTRQLEVAGWLRDETIAVDNMQTRDAADEETLSFALPASADRKSDPQAPLSFDDFELKDVLGRGGMGTVFRATQISLAKTVAIKILRGGSDGEQGNVPRFLKEARAVAQLRHPNIVGVHGIGRDPDGRYFIVMDLVEGGSLRERVEGRSISVDEAIDVVADVAEAIEHAHRKGFLHRDLKPGNILLDESGTPMVTDFGLVKRIATTDPSSVSISGEIVGTPN